MNLALAEVEVSPATPSFREFRRRKRAKRRAALDARAATRIDPAASDEARAGLVAADKRTRTPPLLATSVSIALHASVWIVAVVVARYVALPPRRVEVPVTIRYAAPPPPPAPAAPEPKVDEPVPPPIPPPPTPVLKKVVPPTVDPIPPTPIDIPTAQVTPPEPPKEPPRRVVGMSSTIVGGAGPAFAAGNTLMGHTSEVASDPASIAPLAAESTPPRRTSAPRPVYPPALREHGIEGAVVVRAEIDRDGHVTNVTVVEPSPHDEFNHAAVDAAMRSTYQPALTNGVAVARAIEFTVRFRLHD